MRNRKSIYIKNEQGWEERGIWAENDVCTSGYIIMCWTLRMSPLEGYREQHEYQTFSLQSCAAYFHSLNVLMKPQYSCSCPARPSTARQTQRDLSASTPCIAAHIPKVGNLGQCWALKPVWHGFPHQTQKETRECLHRSFTYKESKQPRTKKNQN